MKCKDLNRVGAILPTHLHRFLLIGCHGDRLGGGCGQRSERFREKRAILTGDSHLQANGGKGLTRREHAVSAHNRRSTISTGQ